MAIASTIVASMQQNASVNESYSDAEYIISSMLVLLEQLNKNEEETRSLQKEIVNFLNKRGVEIDLANVEILSETFRASVKNSIKFITIFSIIKMQRRFAKII